MADVKITKKDNFRLIQDIVNRQVEITQEVRDRVYDFAEHEIGLLDKKTVSHKSKVSEEDQGYMDTIQTILASNEEGMTASEIMLSDDTLPKTTQKITGLLGRLKKVGTVTKVKEGKKSIYKLTEGD